MRYSVQRPTVRNALCALDYDSYWLLLYWKQLKTNESEKKT